ncbi:hypothetical protein DPMN_147563 [Dreissena polymorpha]|uniref:Uncharacterized protein n=1 Tax=Dreissena polymorpha TaxID=45954 RepID=A0A9D4F7Z4_DREPO|nr:hypothetical protein DPMN_147563 [Dreissena polymorpha]
MIIRPSNYCTNICTEFLSPEVCWLNVCLPLQAQRSSIQQDDLALQDKGGVQGEEQQQKITTYEEAFKEIKEATGVSDTMVMPHFFVFGVHIIFYTFL